MESLSTSKKEAPVARFTLACPLPTDQGVAPARMPATGLSTPGMVMTPTMLFQRTIESSLSNANTADAHIKVSITANIFFISLVLIPSFEKQVLIGLTGPLSRVGKESNPCVEVTVAFSVLI
jgi:hypothetical protein